MKNETSITEESIELINRQFVRLLTAYFPFKKFSSFIMVLIFNCRIKRVPFASQLPKRTEKYCQSTAALA
ncbi:protein of unknown function [Serratia sp. Tan611]|nr:protein of unknown function [Serratia sp. Tan611]